MVIVGHAYPLTGRGTFDIVQVATGGLVPLAHMGVCVFFVISGYLVCQSLDTSPTVRGYLWKRCLRIFPGLLFALLVTVFLIGLLNTQLPVREYLTNKNTYLYFISLKLFPVINDSLPSVFVNNPLTNINGSLWTLAYEFSMYFLLILAWPLIKHARRWCLGLSVVGLLAFVPFTDYFYSYHYTVPLVKLDLYHFLDFGVYFLSGVFYYAFRDKITWHWQVAVLLVVFQISTLWLDSAGARFLMRYLCVPYLVFYVGFWQGRLNNFGNYGDYSYGIYVFGYPVQQFIVSIMSKNISVFMLSLLSFIFVMPLAWVSWHGIEKQMMQFKKWII